jgi:hypothetical protein
MRKFLCILITTSMLFLSNVKPASANIVFDLTEIISEISEVVGKITDAAGKITNSVNMVKQTLSQGFSKEMLLKVVGKVAGKYINAFIASKTANKIVEAADAKNKEIYKQEVDTYVAAIEEDIKAKEEETSQQKREVMLAIAKMKTAVLAQTSVVKLAGEKCDNAIVGRKKACELYGKERSKLDTMTLELRNLEAKDRELDEVKKSIAKQKIDMKEDPKIKKLEARVEDIENRVKEKEAEMAAKKQEKEELIRKAKEEAQWDAEESLLEDFNVNNKDYEFFLNTYFYNSKNINEGENKFIAHQGKRDDVERERRQLLIDASIHLMQVTATLRADATSRRILIEEFTKTTVEGEGETESISSYSATKIEYIRALLLYAKMQTAKLQYLAAKEIIDLNETKSFEQSDIKNYMNNDLKRWQLTTKDVMEKIRDNGRESLNAKYETWR